MLTLAAADTLAGVASSGSKVTCTVFGMELAAGVETYKVLDQRQLASSVATIYTVPADTTAFVRSITVVNTDTVAAMTFQLFRGGTSAANAITPVFTIPAGGSYTYEDGLGWSAASIATGTTLASPTFTTSAAFTGYSDQSAIANPSAPAADTLRTYARKVSGRMLPKWMGPSGVDTPVQPAFFGNNVVIYTPNTGTTAGLAFGTPWAATTTVAHPQPTAGIYTQMKRTTSTMVVTTQNQTLGVSAIVSTAAQFWRGNAAGLGGFFFFTRFGIETLTTGNFTIRLFAGLMSGTTNILASDTVPAISCVGLWHDTTEGAGVLNIVTKDGSTAATKNALAGSPTTPIATGQGYDFYLYAKPNDSVIYYRLYDLNLRTVLSEGPFSTNLPANTTFMGPVVGMSNGTANTTAGQVAVGINRIYVESDH